MLAPLGRVLLGLAALGLLGYAMWRLFQGVLDPDCEGGDARGLIKRADHVVNGLFHAALVVSVGRVALGSGGGGGPDDWTATLLQQHLGRLLVGSSGPGSSPSASSLAAQPFGPYLLELVAFGLFMFVVARYRRIQTS